MIYATYNPVTNVLTGINHTPVENSVVVPDLLVEEFSSPLALQQYMYNPIRKTITVRLKMVSSFEIRRWKAIKSLDEVKAWGVLVSPVGPKGKVIVVVNPAASTVLADVTTPIYLTHRYEPDWVLAKVPFKSGIYQFPHWYKFISPVSYVFMEEFYHVLDFDCVKQTYDSLVGDTHVG